MNFSKTVKHFNLFAIILILYALPIKNFKAQDLPAISISVANFNVLKTDQNSLEGRIEYRHRKVNYDAIPFIGMMANSDGAVHVFGGLMYDIKIGENFFITPSFAPGIYHKGNSKNLDFLLEFRTQVEITIRLKNNARFGVNFNHISNGRLSLYNPGVESLALTYIFQL